ncbi:MAG: hypothetical protein DMG08_19130 [Acidobacteria bacterium]|nr:MAG: hypothetical protein DMG08_19130 [Acidobacteriota bacterium]
MVKFCVMAGAGSEFSLQAALAPGRLKPELQTGRPAGLFGSWGTCIMLRSEARGEPPIEGQGLNTQLGTDRSSYQA